MAAATKKKGADRRTASTSSSARDQSASRAVIKLKTFNVTRYRHGRIIGIRAVILPREVVDVEAVSFTFSSCTPTIQDEHICGQNQSNGTAATQQRHHLHIKAMNQVADC